MSAEPRGTSLGDGDAAEDWAPPSAPRKPTLSICLDTRRRNGHTHPLVSVSSSLSRPPTSPPSAPLHSRTDKTPTRRNAWSHRRTAWVKKERAHASCTEVAQPECAQQTTSLDDSAAAFAAAIADTLIASAPSRDAKHAAGCTLQFVKDTDIATAPATESPDGSSNGIEKEATADSGAHVGGDQRDDPTTTRTDKDRAIASATGTPKNAAYRYSRAPSSTNVLAAPEERQRFAGALVAALVERPYGLTFAEVARLAEELSGVRCTGHDARLLIRDIPRDTVVVRRMMTPWFVPRVAVALDTRIALERVVAPAVAHVLCSCSNGIDIQRLDVTVFARTGTSLRVHAANYAGGSLRGVLSFVPQVVGRIEKIAQRVVVYPTGHTRATALFAPLDDHAKDDGNGGRPDADDARVSRSARCDVKLATTIEAAASACAEVTAVALESCGDSDATVVVDCRGPIGGRQARGPPVGMLQVSALIHDKPAGRDAEAGERTRQTVHQFDMVALHAEWMQRVPEGRVSGAPTFFHAIGIADLLADNRLVKVVFDSRMVSQTFWRHASCPMTRVFDMRLATLALGVGAAVPWSDNDTLAAMGSVIDADMHELDAMAGTDAWAWHRRPLPLRARGAAARQAAGLAHAYRMAVAMHEATRSPPAVAVRASAGGGGDGDDVDGDVSCAPEAGP
nr:ribonuclease H-like domain motif-containing [Pandoravirus massiliensis]